MSEKKRYANVGGQAVMEGIMMRSPIGNVLAVRRADGTIQTEPFPVSDFSKKHRWARVPVIRGVVSFVLSISVGIRALSASADYVVADTEEKKEDAKEASKKKESENGGLVFGSLLVGILLAFALFIFLPTLLCEGLEKLFSVSFGVWKSVIIGVIKILIFLGYILAISAMKDIRRLFQYHGAEHKTIFCFEAKKELTVKNVHGFSRLHPRCGTSFLLITIVVSLVFYSFLSMIPAFRQMQDALPFVYMLVKILFLPVLAGLSFEVLKFTGRHDNLFTRILSAPGKWFQLLTTRDPDDDQIEVAIAALKASLINPETGELDEDAAYTS